MRNKIRYLLISFLFFTVFSFAQNRYSDSLRSLLKSDKEDTTKIKHLNALAWEKSFSNSDTAILLSNQALILAEQLGSQKLIAESNYVLGAYYDDQGDFTIALNYYHKALEIGEADEKLQPHSKDTSTYLKGIYISRSKIIGCIGLVYGNQSEYAKALDHYLKALSIAEKLGNKSLTGTWLGNIGGVYNSLGDHKKSLDYYFKALKLAELTKDVRGIPRQIGNIGLIYSNLGDYEKALEYLNRALKLNEGLDSKTSISSNLNNIGNIYLAKKEYKKCLEYYLRALKITEEFGSKRSLSLQSGNLGTLYFQMMKESEGKDKKEYKENAEKYTLKAIAIADSIGYKAATKEYNHSISLYYTEIGDHTKALKHFKLAMAAKDSIFNETKTNEITKKELNYEFEKQAAKLKQEQDKKNADAASQSFMQKLVIGFSIGGVMIVLVFAFYFLRSLKVTRQQKLIIEEKNLETLKQKDIIEMKQKEIIDSINYASRIQLSLLPTEKYIDRTFKRLRKVE